MSAKMHDRFFDESLGQMNAAVALLIVFALLFVILGVSKAFADLRQRQALTEVVRPPSPDQPPIIVLPEAEGFSFESGRADLPLVFRDALSGRIIPELLSLGDQYRCDVIDCIGHTDEQKITSSVSNLDVQLLQNIYQPHGVPLAPGSNADLGLMRCWSVISYLERDGRLSAFKKYGLSAGQTILPSGGIAKPGQGPKNDPARRRIELRLRRSAHNLPAISTLAVEVEGSRSMPWIAWFMQHLRLWN